MFKRSKEIQVTPCCYDDGYYIVLEDITALQPKGILQKYSVVKNVKDLTPLITVDSDYRSQVIDVDTNECVEFYGQEMSNIRLDKFLTKYYDILDAKEREKYVKAAVRYKNAIQIPFIFYIGTTVIALFSYVKYYESLAAFIAFILIEIIHILMAWMQLKRIKDAIILRSDRRMKR